MQNSTRRMRNLKRFLSWFADQRTVLPTVKVGPTGGGSVLQGGGGALGFNRLEAEEQQLWRMIKMARGYSTCRSAQSQDLLPRVARSANQSALQLLLTEDAKAAEETA